MAINVLLLSFSFLLLYTVLGTTNYIQKAMVNSVKNHIPLLALNSRKESRLNRLIAEQCIHCRTCRFMYLADRTLHCSALAGRK